MPDEPVWKEFGAPLSEGTKTSDEIFDARYGKYKPLDMPGKPGKPASAAMDPKPFNVTGK